ncbi:hypothetical protein Q5Y75_07895 [Ruegeria sp. 2205SS24-7]|uniref:hypothetical protein n=1 Tax=Ruegeria discodermiae TaxID=3064389 RepID=UPI0027418471|nr:hypothetical protein [Ruegeria sp. 2205SS24-7]MDP5217135.1 hypothetical protein [Ruegeria sp. 2205SS24-7]
MRLVYLSVIALVGLSACDVSPPENVSRQVATTSDFEEGEISWCRYYSDGDSTCFATYNFLWDAIVVDGEIEICGIGYASKTTRKPINRKMMRSARIEYQGRTILRDLSFFYDAETNPDIIGRSSNCRKTRVTARGSLSNLNLIIPNTGEKIRL